MNVGTVMIYLERNINNHMHSIMCNISKENAIVSYYCTYQWKICYTPESVSIKKRKKGGGVS